MMQAVVHAFGVYAENAVEVFLTRCLGRSNVGDTGVVDQYGDLPELFDRLLGGVLHARRV